MHSSRMCTARFLAVSPSMHCAGGLSAPGGVSAPRGGVCSWGWCLFLGGVCSQGGLLSSHALRQTCPACEQNDWQTGVKPNLRKLRFRAVIIGWHSPSVLANPGSTTVKAQSHQVKAKTKAKFSWMFELFSSISFAGSLILVHFHLGFIRCECIGGSKGGAREARPPGGPNSFIFMKNNSNFGSWRIPPPGENPGSATGMGP